MDGNHGETHPKGSDFISTGIPFVMASDINDNAIDFSGCKYINKEQADGLRKGFSQEGDVLLSHKATIGRTAIVPKTSLPYLMLTPQVTYYRVLDKEKLDNRFLKYHFDNTTFQKTLGLWAGAGSTRAYLGITGQKNLPLQIPKIERQREIADVLSALDKKIELNNKINTELEAMAKLIYDYWFVQLDFPDANGKPYKFSGGKMVHNEELKRDIPEGWEVKSLGKTVKTSLGGTPSTTNPEYWNNANIAWLNSGEVAKFPVLDSEEKITQAGIDNSAAELLPKGSVIISIVRHLRVSILAIDAAFNQSVVGLYETDALKNSFLYPYLSRELSRLMLLRTGAQQPHINKGIVDASRVVIPPDNILKKYYQSVDSTFEKINVTAMESMKLKEIRDSLLPMLMNGQVRVKS